MKRESGYYWIKYGDYWYVGHYDSVWFFRTVYGENNFARDDELNEIDERKIERQ